MIDLAFVIQGKTFLKTMFPLIVFSNNCGIKPIMFCMKSRSGKKYDNLNKQKLNEIIDPLKDQLFH